MENSISSHKKVSSRYTYPDGYKPNLSQPIDIIIAEFERQVVTLDQFFNCGTRFNPDWIVRAHALCPPWVEKFFAHFDWRSIASTYGEAVDKVLEAIKSERKFYNYRDGQLGAEYLRQHQKTVKAFQKLGDEQKANGQSCDILVVPAQFGLRHRGRSVRRAREVMNAVEFGLGVFSTGCMTLTHPERFVWGRQLHVDCAGDEFSPCADGDFSCAPVLGFDGDGGALGAGWFDSADEGFGSASGFLQSLRS